MTPRTQEGGEAVRRADEREAVRLEEGSTVWDASEGSSHAPERMADEAVDRLGRTRDRRDDSLEGVREIDGVV